MTYRLFVREIARNEILSSARYYESKSPSLGLQFLDRMDDIFDLIKTHPQLFPICLESFRRALVKQFPYAVFYEIDDHSILVSAVLYHHQDQSVLKDR